MGMMAAAERPPKHAWTSRRQMQRAEAAAGTQARPATSHGKSGCSCGGGCPKCQGAARSEAPRGGLSLSISPAPVARGDRTEASDDPAEQTTTSGSTSGNRIDVTFDPTSTTPTPDCDRLILTQWIQMTADGSPIMPGTYYTPWTCRDPTALSDCTYLDHGSCAYKTPYPVDRGIGSAGWSNASGSSPATYYDAPTTGGGDKGFRSSSNPGGWQTVTYYFGNYAFCAAGTDCGTWYDGVGWEYTKTAADHAAGRAGKATATASLLPPSPGDRIIDAFDQYNSVKGFTPCLYSSTP